MKARLLSWSIAGVLALTARRLGLKACLRKPVDDEALLSAVGTAIGAASA